MNSESFSQGPDLEKPKRGMENAEIQGEVVVLDPRKSKRTPKRRSGCGCWPLSLVLGCLLTCCICCVTPFCVLVAGGSAVAAVFDSNKATVTETQTAKVTQDEIITLEVSNTMGDVTVEHGVNDEVIVRSVKTAYGFTKGAAQDELSAMQVNLTQPDPTTVKIDVQKDQVGKFQLRISTTNLTISVPDNVHVVVKTGTGDIKVSGLKVQSLDLTSGIGMIEYTGAMPASSSAVLNLETSTGEIRVHLPKDTAVQIDAKTTVGELTVASNFAHVEHTASGSQDSVNKTWLGTLGNSKETPPTLKLRTAVGAIVVDVR